jgi:drug/metabolite transporter (DMT)-like permease
MVIQGYVYSWSQFYLPLPIVVTIYAATPVFSALFDWLIFGVGINFKQKVWLAVAVVGVVLTANGGSLMNSTSSSEQGEA